MLKPADLTVQEDFEAGSLRISPARRELAGPAGTAHLEPIVMQVLLVLLEGRGRVVTRTELFEACWGNGIVGDDSLNRAIARLRRVLSETAPEQIEIETIPRTGYRLTGIAPSPARQDGQTFTTAATHSLMSRRVLLGSAIAVCSAGGAGVWWLRNQSDHKFADLLSRGEEALDFADPSADAVQYFRQAVLTRPGDARAQGLLAYSQAMRAEFEAGGAAAVEEAKQATHAALEIDPTEPNARLAQSLLQRAVLDLATTEDRTREILANAPGNVFAMRQMWSLLQCAGRSRNALAFVERALALKPLAAANNFPRAQLLWIVGRTGEADRVIDRALQYWPTQGSVRFARFTILAFTNRPRAALAMLDDERLRPQAFSSQSVAVWRVSLRSLEQPTPANKAAARQANIDAAKSNLRLTSQAVLVLSILGEVDAALELTKALFAVNNSSGHDLRARSTAWRFAPWLFTPPAAAIRAHPAFGPLCDGIGLTDYWAKRRIKPDYQLSAI